MFTVGGYMNFSDVIKRTKIQEQILSTHDIKLLEEQDDDMLLSIGKHILLQNYTELSEYHRQVDMYKSLSRDKRLLFIKKYMGVI